MLVLTRRAGQALRIGGSIEVRVVRIEGDRVVLGVVAPREISVVRDELIAEVAAETRTAGDAAGLVRDALRRRA
jgi:carbon storage regulator